MKNISPKRIAIGVVIGMVVGFGIVFAVTKYATNANYPYVGSSDEATCAERTTHLPWVSQEKQVQDFKDCLARIKDEK